MTIIRFYTDTHVSKRIVSQLQATGVDVIRCHNRGLEDAADETHLETAAAEYRTIITADKDFLRLNAEWNQARKFHAGILYIPAGEMQDIGLVVQKALFLHEAVKAGAAILEDDIYNQVVRV
jgi:predicted nuclease of predicted toxin-antitoxin system